MNVRDRIENNSFFFFSIFISFVISHLHYQRMHIIDLETFLTFQGDLPFQARVLSFLVVRVVADLFHLDYTGQAVKNIFIFQDFISLLVVTHLITKLGYRYIHRSNPWILALILYWQFLFMFIISEKHPYWYPYDITQIAFITLYLYGVSQHWSFTKLLPVFILGTLNRETMIFAAIFHWALLEKNWLSKVAVLSLSWVSLKLMLSWIFKDSSGSGVSFGYYDLQNQWACNLFSCYVPRAFRNTTVLFGEIIHVMAAFGFLWLIISFRWKELSTPLQRMIKTFFLFFGGMFLVGNIDEIRIFGEYIPMVTLAVGAIICNDVSGSASYLAKKRYR